jgi:hypothetical protein
VPFFLSFAECLSFFLSPRRPHHPWPPQGRNYLSSCKTVRGYFAQRMVNKSNPCWRTTSCTQADNIGSSFYAICACTLQWQVRRSACGRKMPQSQQQCRGV